MTSTHRGVRPVSVAVSNPSAAVRQNDQVQIEARWLVSGQAVRLGRPDLARGSNAREVSLRWTLTLAGDADPRFIRGHAALDAGGGSDPVELVAMHEGDPGSRVDRDDEHDLTTIRLTRHGRELLLLVVAGDVLASRARTSPGQPLLVYARTCLLNDPAPLGLHVGGGRYEFAGVSRRPVG
ncbi:MAG: hypothetical protein AMXMBFR58_10770 [Phycisphaerae bacterium]